MERISIAALLSIMAMWGFCTGFESPFGEAEKYPEYWNAKARENLRISLKRLTTNNNPAKNVILFIGDGMDITTITAGRILKGQRSGVSGEEAETSMERFPHVGLSKVYTLDSQTPDSAGTASALMTGVKTKTKMLGVSGKTEFENCKSSKGNELKTILENSADMGKSTGIVTTTYVQHATPASAYAHSASRGWINDGDLTPEANREDCKDIASQLIEQGRRINVILGGGRAYMRPKGFEDEEYQFTKDIKYGRDDERNLIEEWQKLEPAENAQYVWDLEGFRNVKPRQVDHLMGLFEPRHMQFEHERENDAGGEPSLAEMTEKALRILRKNEEGYFLLVEGGKIDHGHHETKANVALSEFLAFDDAVETAVRMTSSEDTLIVVTADHGHMFNLGGYAVRGNPIHGFAENHNMPELARDGLVYTSVVYGNGVEWLGNKLNQRLSLTEEMTKNVEFRFPAAIPLLSETHSASDVAVLARGPMAHLFGGVYEQNYVGYAMMYASCVGPDRRHCKEQGRHKTWQCPGQDSTSDLRKKKLQSVNPALIRSDEQRAYNKHLPWWCTEAPLTEWVPPVVTDIKAPGSTEDPENTMFHRGYTTQAPYGRGSDVDNVWQRPIPRTVPRHKKNVTPAPITRPKWKGWNSTPRPGSAANRGTPRNARPTVPTKQWQKPQKQSNFRSTTSRPRVPTKRPKPRTPRPNKLHPTTATRRPKGSQNRGTSRPKKAQPTVPTKQWQKPQKQNNFRPTTSQPRIPTKRPKIWNAQGTARPRNPRPATATKRPTSRHGRGTTVRPRKPEPTTAGYRPNSGTRKSKKHRSTTATPHKKQSNNGNRNGKTNKQHSGFGGVRTMANGKRPTGSPHRVFRRELTTEYPETVSNIEKYHMDLGGTPETPVHENAEYRNQVIPDENFGPDPTEKSEVDVAITAKIFESRSVRARLTRNSQSSATAQQTNQPRERFLDLIAKAIRTELTHINVYSEDPKPATLNLAIKVSPVYNGDSANSEGPEKSVATTNAEPMVVCMQWSSDAGMVALGPNSSKIAFIYDDDNPNFAKQVSPVATGGSDQTAAVVMLSILTVAFFLLAAALFYMFRKRSEELRKEIEERERDRKREVLSKMRLQNVEEEEIPRQHTPPNINNNSSVAPLAKAKKAVKGVGRWCGNAFDARSLRKSRQITGINF